MTWPIIVSCKSGTSERQLFVFCLHHQCTFYQWTENWPKSAISRAWVCHFRNFAELQDKGALVQALCRQIYISATFCAKTRQHLGFPYIHWLDAQCTEKTSESWAASELEILCAFASHKVIYHLDVPGAVWWESRKVLQRWSAIRNNRTTNLRQQITQGWSHVCSAVINCKTLLHYIQFLFLPRFLVVLCSKSLKSICSDVFNCSKCKRNKVDPSLWECHTFGKDTSSCQLKRAAQNIGSSGCQDSVNWWIYWNVCQTNDKQCKEEHFKVTQIRIVLPCE